MFEMFEAVLRWTCWIIWCIVAVRSLLVFSRSCHNSGFATWPSLRWREAGDDMVFALTRRKLCREIPVFMLRRSWCWSCCILDSHGFVVLNNKHSSYLCPSKHGSETWSCFNLVSWYSRPGLRNSLSVILFRDPVTSYMFPEQRVCKGSVHLF